MRNRISVMWDWFWTYLTYRSGTRLITGGAPVVESAQVKPADTMRRVATV